MARIILNETSYFGKGAISNVATEVKARGLKKVLLVTDKDLVKFNVATKVMKVMDDAGIPYTVYDDIKANPTIENVQTGVEICKKEQIHNFCAPNAIMTLKEYLVDYASNETKLAGEKLIKQELLNIDNPILKEEVIKNLENIEKGIRDLKF